MAFSRNRPSPIWHWQSVLLGGLSLSIGWGIRGNFGHEYGAAFAGCLAAIVIALVSGRSDWQQRVLYFAFFGAIGWGFGASVSYMQVIAYTMSGQSATQLYGYAALFYIGFLWAGLGGAGTTLAAVAERERLVKLFKPILFVFGIWFLQDLIEDPIAHALQSGIKLDHTASRHKSPLYWFDADYLAASTALLAMGVYDLLDQKSRQAVWLPAFAAAGASVGWLIQYLLHTLGLDQPLAALLTYPLGDPTYINPETGKLAFDPHNFLNNWPQWFGDYPTHIGWVVGLIIGLIAYFVRFGKFRNGASLIVYMASGWLLAFLALPVFGSLFFADYGGLRMTPPRSDDWAGITGVFIGMISWMRRHQLRPVAVASVISGTIGGLGFSGIQWVKHLLMAPGSPRILAGRGVSPDSPEFKTTVANWADWQQQNWHSFLEQSYGFVNGIAIVVALGFLATRIPLHKDHMPNKPAQGKWTLGVATVFVLLAIPYVNLIKNVEEWGKQLNPEVWTRTITQADGTQEIVPALWDVPYLGRLPGVDFLHMTPGAWFTLTWLLLLCLFIILIRRHSREPIALIPAYWLGKGQLIFLILLWLMIVGNFERALVNWHPDRILTEWGVTLNAILATLLVLTVPTEKAPILIQIPASYDPVYKQAWIRALLAMTVSVLFFWQTNRLIYHYPPHEKLDNSIHFRFGPEADWRARPNLKNAQHK
ncbi:hypothetical protein GO730_11860 [Spirosoma sp. HMF3257]|uniref:Uncharacterized protein n=1 Tax=Spirosoma telluris TaxID=2183553 RepID=A0A327NZV1_9BACT|nr:hypothetical protein [Spirosoma telluris]RAI78428.1 hypothetical protein HMF3257_11775 [Spirosoma telluris]